MNKEQKKQYNKIKFGFKFDEEQEKQIEAGIKFKC